MGRSFRQRVTAAPGRVAVKGAHPGPTEAPSRRSAAPCPRGCAPRRSPAAAGSASRSLPQVSAARGLRSQRWLLRYATPPFPTLLSPFPRINVKICLNEMWARGLGAVHARWHVWGALRCQGRTGLHPELQPLMRGCDALIMQKEDKNDQNTLSFRSKCEKGPYYIKVDPKQRPWVVIFSENSIEVCCF